MADIVISGEATLEEIRAFFSNDRYATVACGAAIEEARPGFSRVSLLLGDNHRNGLGSVMGAFHHGRLRFCGCGECGQPSYGIHELQHRLSRDGEDRQARCRVSGGERRTNPLLRSR